MSSTESIEPSHANSVEQDNLDISIYLTMRIESQSIEIDNLKKENEMKSIKISQLEDSLRQTAKGIGEHVARISYLEIKLKENKSSFQSVETVTQQIVSILFKSFERIANCFFSFFFRNWNLHHPKIESMYREVTNILLKVN